MTRPTHDAEPVGDILPRVMDGIRPDSISSTPSASETVITLTLRPLPGVDPVIALRQALKRLLRSHGLRCVNIEARGWPGAISLTPSCTSHGDHQPAGTPAT